MVNPSTSMIHRSITDLGLTHQEATYLQAIILRDESESIFLPIETP